MNISTKKSTNVSTTDSQIPPEKVITRISYKPKARDEDNFIPLVDIDNSSDRARLTKDDHNSRESAGWITQTHTVEISHRNASVAEGTTEAPPHDEWTTDKPMTGKEHV